MCEIFGAYLKKERRLNEYLKEFYSHCDMHPHGWGLAVLDGNETVIEKEPERADRSKYLKQRISVPIENKIVFAHIRYATIGNVYYQNCHPFTGKDDTGRRWTLNHNGTIFDFPPASKYVSIQSGDTDSERILMYIIDQANALASEKEEVTADDRFRMLDGIVQEMARNNNKLNFLLYDGELLYVHTNYKDSLYYMTNRDGVIVSTQPLGNNKEEWKNVPFTTLAAFKQNELVYTGTNHGHEHILNEEDMKYIYQIFSDL